MNLAGACTASAASSDRTKILMVRRPGCACSPRRASCRKGQRRLPPRTQIKGPWFLQSFHFARGTQQTFTPSSQIVELIGINGSIIAAPRAGSLMVAALVPPHKNVLASECQEFFSIIREIQPTCRHLSSGLLIRSKSCEIYFAYVTSIFSC